MALVSADLFASFDVPSGAYIQDISPALVEAVYFDLNFLEAVPMDWDMPVDDTVHIWNEDALNTDLITSSASIASNGTTLAVTSTNAVTVNGMLLMPRLSGATEILQVTAGAGAGATSLTVTRGYNSTTTASYPSGTQFVVLDALQEGSDIGIDSSLAPAVRQNNTHIAGCRDLKVAGSQLARRMATTAMQDWVGHQLANRAIELKRKWIFIFIYSEPSSSAVGSDSVYRTLKGVRSWTNSAAPAAQKDADSEALALSVLDPMNKSMVDQGDPPDTLLIGTDLVNSVAAIEATNRRLYESDTKVGYTVTSLVLKQGNEVRVVVDSRVNPGDAFLFAKSRIHPKPFRGRGMFTISATDFSDARKRRILSEWTLQVENPELLGYASAKT